MRKHRFEVDDIDRAMWCREVASQLMIRQGKGPAEAWHSASDAWGYFQRSLDAANACLPEPVPFDFDPEKEDLL
jgi:hypothetical protein